MNGHHNTNGVPQPGSPRPSANGGINSSSVKPVQPQPSFAKSPDKTLNLTNGNVPTNPSHLSTHHSPDKMDKVPEELMEMLRTRIPDDAYVPMARLVSRAAKTCWSQLITVLNELAQIQPPDPQTVTKRLKPPDQTVINDDSVENQRKKMKLWNFAEDHKRAFIKLLVILMWSSKSEDNKLTIALNFEIHAMRSAFSSANDKLNEWIVYIVSRQDACPDLDTALEVLATGRVAGVPDLGFAEPKPLTDKQMLSTVYRLNRALAARMVHENDLPAFMKNWTIHDGRITFRVPQEFELDLSVMEETDDAPFMLVDVRFDYRPRPPISDDIHDQLTTITNQGLMQKGLQGAYEFLHQTCLTLKLKELHTQALALVGGLWNGHLGVELLKRTLIVQYWTRRTVTKSWIEIGINSGRAREDASASQPSTASLYLKWMKNGAQVLDHDIVLDLDLLSFENILNQVIAQHVNSIFDGIFDGLVANKLYAKDDLDLDQDSSMTDAYDCKLRIGITKIEDIRLSCDPVAGTLVISPPSARSSRLQYELTRSKNVIDDFVARFPALRCAIAQNKLVDAMQGNSLQYLPGLKPSFAEVKFRFGPEALRAAFFRRPGWPPEWLLAASFGRHADTWWLVHQTSSEDASSQAQKLDTKPLHLQDSFTEGYFETIRKIASAEISMAVSRRTLDDRNIVAQDVVEAGSTRLSFSLTDDQSLDSIDRKVMAWPGSSKRASHDNAVLLAMVRLRASKRVLEKLASAGLDSAITVHVDKQLLLLSLSGPVGSNKIDELLDRLHYINDLISCIKLVDGVKKLSMQSLTMENIVIDYHTSSQVNLGLKLFFRNAKSKAKLQLLPTDRNPHSIIAEHVNPTLVNTKGPLSERLRTILSILTATLPLVSGLSYLQGLTDVSEVPQMSAIELGDSRDWIKVHVMSRDMVRFGVHFYAQTPKFKKDVESEVIPPKLLVRLEIETMANSSGGKQGWIVRPAVEEFRTYIRPSFTSQALAQRLKDKVFSYTSSKNWMGLGSAARCLFDNPYDLLITIHDTLLSWLKEAVVKKEEGPGPTQARAVPPKPLPANPGVNKPAVAPVRPPGQNLTTNQQHAVQGQGQRTFPQNRPVGAQQMANQNGPSRVMTAIPQQVRPPPNAGRGRGQMFPARGGGLTAPQRGPNGANGTGGTQNDAIQLD